MSEVQLSAPRPMSTGTKVLHGLHRDTDTGSLLSSGMKSRNAILNRHIEPTYVELYGIPFRVRHEGGYYFLECDKWPILSAFGESLIEAVGGLNHALQDVLDNYVFADAETLSADAIEFRNYLISKLMPI